MLENKKVFFKFVFHRKKFSRTEAELAKFIKNNNC